MHTSLHEAIVQLKINNFDTRPNLNEILNELKVKEMCYSV